MLRSIFSAIGLAEAVAPKTLIDAAEATALENPADCELRRWVVPGARIEGLLLLLLTWRSDRTYAALKRFLGLVGLLALLFPRSYLEFGASLAYTEKSTPDWHGWVYPGTRIIGLLYVLVALDELRNRPSRSSVD